MENREESLVDYWIGLNLNFQIKTFWLLMEIDQKILNRITDKDIFWILFILTAGAESGQYYSGSKNLF